MHCLLLPLPVVVHDGVSDIPITADELHMRRQQTQHQMHTHSQLCSPVYLNFAVASAVTIHCCTEDLRGMREIKFSKWDDGQTPQLGSTVTCLLAFP